MQAKRPTKELNPSSFYTVYQPRAFAPLLSTVLYTSPTALAGKQRGMQKLQSSFAQIACRSSTEACVLLYVSQSMHRCQRCGSTQTVP